jgi:hypothetical protein
MGVLLDEIYKVVTEKAGLKGRMRLAVMTGIPRTKAVQMEDSAEIVSKFKSAADEIVGVDIDEFFKGR